MRLVVLESGFNDCHDGEYEIVEVPDNLDLHEEYIKWCAKSNECKAKYLGFPDWLKNCGVVKHKIEVFGW